MTGAPGQARDDDEMLDLHPRDFLIGLEELRAHRHREVQGQVRFLDRGDDLAEIVRLAGNLTGGTAAINQAGYQGYDNTVFPTIGSATQNLRLASASFR